MYQKEKTPGDKAFARAIASEVLDILEQSIEKEAKMIETADKTPDDELHRLREAVKWLEDGLKAYAIEENWGTPDKAFGMGMENHLFYEIPNMPGWSFAARRLKEARNIMQGK